MLRDAVSKTRILLLAEFQNIWPPQNFELATLLHEPGENAISN